MQDHKVGNFMVKGIILGLHLENGLKSLRIKLLMSWVGSQLRALGVHLVYGAYVRNMQTLIFRVWSIFKPHYSLMSHFLIGVFWKCSWRRKRRLWEELKARKHLGFGISFLLATSRMYKLYSLITPSCISRHFTLLSYFFFLKMVILEHDMFFTH